MVNEVEERLVPLDKMDALLERGRAIQLESGLAVAARFLAEHRIDPGQFDLPEDADSPEYRDAQMQIYRRVSGVNDYDPAVHEALSANVEAQVRRPAPFCDGSMVATGEHLIAYGSILRLLALPAGARVIEYGQGNGNIALLLGLMEVKVTTIDIAPDQAEIVRRRAARIDVPVTAAVGQFGDAPPDGERVDAIVFYEAFHHASDPVGVLRKLRERLVPGGRVVFAGEPIVEDPARPWLGPWGVRLDGQSVSAMRQLGCHEIGFSRSYFVSMLMRNGFVVSFHSCKETTIGDAWVAKLGDGIFNLNNITLPPDEDATWGPGHSDPKASHRFATDKSCVTLHDDPVWNSVRVTLHNYLSVPLTAIVAVGKESSQVAVSPAAEATVELPLPAGRRQLRVSSEMRSLKESNMGDDTQPLGLAVQRIQLSTSRTKSSPKP